MILKYGVVTTFPIIEGIIFDSPKSRRIDSGKKFRRTLEKARDAGIVTESLFTDLVHVRDLREDSIEGMAIVNSRQTEWNVPP